MSSQINNEMSRLWRTNAALGNELTRKKISAGDLTEYNNIVLIIKVCFFSLLYQDLHTFDNLQYYQSVSYFIRCITNLKPDTKLSYMKMPKIDFECRRQSIAKETRRHLGEVFMHTGGLFIHVGSAWSTNQR